MNSLLSRLWCAAAAVLLALGLSAVPANAQTLYGITFDEELITIDTTTGAGTLVGPLSSDMNGFGLGARSGNLYTYDQTAKRIRQLNPTTGATVDTIDVGLSLVGEGALDFRADGVGFLSSSMGGTGSLFSFDITGPSSTGIGALIPSMDGMAFSPGGVLYGLSQGLSADSALYTIDQTTGATTLIGSLGVGGGILGGLDFFPDGTLYATTATNLYTVNPTTGAATLIGPIGFDNVSGLASMKVAPPGVVPEPCSLALLLTGSLAGAGSVLRRRRA